MLVICRREVVSGSLSNFYVSYWDNEGCWADRKENILQSGWFFLVSQLSLGKPLLRDFAFPAWGLKKEDEILGLKLLGWADLAFKGNIKPKGCEWWEIGCKSLVGYTEVEAQRGYFYIHLYSCQHALNLWIQILSHFPGCCQKSQSGSESQPAQDTGRAWHCSLDCHCGGVTLAGHWVPPKTALTPLLSLAEKENTVKGSLLG